MITRDNITDILLARGFTQEGNCFTKQYDNAVQPLKVDVSGNGKIFYEDCGIEVGRDTTSNFSDPENFVVLECVDRLLSMGYNARHIELEPHWKLGHSQKGGYADIWVRTFKDNAFTGSADDKESLLIIECKKADEFNGAWADTREDGAQLFSYFQQEPATKFLCLYTSDFVDGEVKPTYRLINVQDNEQLLEADKTAESYSDKNDKQRYRVWKNTYQLEYATRGLFEDDVQPYHIGKSRYTITDLRPVDDETEIQHKYHEFALILRQHNVGGHENAFDKLVNLFLAKVVDETNNPESLHFYWKGAAYDDDYQLQDRLQRLYRDGMMKFLGEEVTYIENGEIDKAFRRFKNDPDATKKTIKEYFRALKFYSDNDFSFISVHNEKLFRQNAVILRKMVQMLQDLRLKSEGEGQQTNQFLGDLFEGFLNKGVKQSEGQFFTPMPIVRFIVSALPLESIVRDSEDVPWAIDYACGAGHFLTEYAVRIREFAQRYRKDIPLKDFYARITGVEKEYRLSKVSKVAAFMYGHDDINIVYADALTPHKDVPLNTYSVLVANPPYAVSGFLDTLTEAERQQYELFNEGINIDKNNAIETFFMERAAQLMKAGGVAGIVLPVSVLNKSGIYTHAREIILQRFDIVALAEFGSGTFGKTGTNTVVMFLRRKETNTPDSDHYRNRVDSWFGNHHDADEVYQDEWLLQEYCRKQGYQPDDYKAFLAGTMTDAFLASEVVEAYHASFFGTGRNAMKDVHDEAKTIRTRYVAHTKTATYRRKTQAEKDAEAAKAFMAFVWAIERDKVYYYLLAHAVQNPVLLVKMPDGNTEGQKFLGYKWSDRKGNEGLKYLNVSTSTTTDDSDDEDDTMEQIQGVSGIQTPLFNPADLNDTDKLNTLIRQNFLGELADIPETLQPYATAGRLEDMLDFTRTAFVKEFKTVFSKMEIIETKYPLIKLNALTQIIRGVTYDKSQQSTKETPFVVLTADNITTDGSFYLAKKVYLTNNTNLSDDKILRRGDIFMCFSSGSKTHVGKSCYIADDTNFYAGGFMGILRVDDKKASSRYVSFALSSNDVHQNIVESSIGSNINNLSSKIGNIQIPLPPLSVQEQIVKECGKVDEESERCKETISNNKQALNDLFESLAASVETVRLSHLCSAINPSKSDVADLPADTMVSFVDMPSVSNDGYIEHKEDRPLSTVRTGSYKYFAEGDIIIAKITPCMENGKCALADGLTGGIGFGSSEFHVFRANEQIDPLFLLGYLNRPVIREQAVLQMTGASGHRRVPVTFYENLQIPVPTPQEQQRVVTLMRQYQAEEQEARLHLSTASAQKQVILDKYLK